MINDEEIDLTEYRDFGREHLMTITKRDGTTYSNFNQIIEKTVRNQIYGKLPWGVSPIFNKEYRYDGLVALGNKQQREDAIYAASWGTLNNINCDCCGKQYTKIPWKKDWGICDECNEQMKRKDKEIDYGI